MQYAGREFRSTGIPPADRTSCPQADLLATSEIGYDHGMMSPKPAYALVSLGCPKNLVDSERMAGLLRLEGYTMTTDLAKADFVVINTCAFVADARRESFAAIDEMLERKRQGQLRGVIVAGCLAERERHQLRQKYPEVDQVVGVFARDEIAAAADRLFALSVAEHEFFRPAPAPPLPDTDRLRITPRHVAYLKISEGCSRTCAFCSIPTMRGPYASKPIEHVVAEARELAADGAKELVIVAQDTSFYGLDIYGRPRLADLLDQLEAIDGVAWIRLMYLYPMHIDDALVDRVAAGGKVLPYLDIPLQHISDPVLAGMKRRVTRLETEQLLDRLRERIDGLVLRTTLLVGFPGETDANFAELCEFVERRRFERLGVFAYCLEPGTTSATAADQVPEEVKQARRDEIMARQQPITFDWAERQVGQAMDVIIDGPVDGQKNAWVGRSRADAPEIDGVVYVSGKRIRPGDIVRCEIVGARGYDLIAARDTYSRSD